MRLKKDNIEKVVNEKLAQTLINQGWKEIKSIDTDVDFAKMTVAELKALLEEKEIEFDAKAKKEELIELLEGAE